MADNTTKSVMSLIATKSSKIKDLIIKNGQLIFMQDAGRIAFDFNNTRVFYNQIVEINTDEERLAMTSPLDGYYFIIDKATLWFYKNGWIQITSEPQQILFIGVELPELGQANKIYINKNKKEISIWDDDSNTYMVVSNFTEEATNEDIQNLFINRKEE